MPDSSGPMQAIAVARPMDDGSEMGGHITRAVESIVADALCTISGEG